MSHIKAHPDDFVFRQPDVSLQRRIIDRQSGKLGDLFRVQFEPPPTMDMQDHRYAWPASHETQIEVDITQTTAYWKSVWES